MLGFQIQVDAEVPACLLPESNRLEEPLHGVEIEKF